MPPADSETNRWFAEHLLPHQPMLRAWLARGFGSRLAIDDVVQEAFLRVLQARETGGLQAPTGPQARSPSAGGSPRRFRLLFPQRCHPSLRILHPA